ncbi:MAG: hypothetical protein AAGD11_00900 [Planctomycetota bacterium]
MSRPRWSVRNLLAMMSFFALFMCIVKGFELSLSISIAFGAIIGQHLVLIYEKQLPRGLYLTLGLGLGLLALFCILS